MLARPYGLDIFRQGPGTFVLKVCLHGRRCVRKAFYGNIRLRNLSWKKEKPTCTSDQQSWPGMWLWLFGNGGLVYIENHKFIDFCLSTVKQLYSDHRDSCGEIYWIYIQHFINKHINRWDRSSQVYQRGWVWFREPCNQIPGLEDIFCVWWDPPWLRCFKWQLFRWSFTGSSTFLHGESYTCCKRKLKILSKHTLRFVTVRVEGRNFSTAQELTKTAVLEYWF